MVLVRPLQNNKQEITTMDKNNMSKESFKICQKIHDEYGINYQDIEISVLNHLDLAEKRSGFPPRRKYN